MYQIQAVIFTHITLNITSLSSFELTWNLTFSFNFVTFKSSYFKCRYPYFTSTGCKAQIIWQCQGKGQISRSHFQIAFYIGILFVQVASTDSIASSSWHLQHFTCNCIFLIVKESTLQNCRQKVGLFLLPQSPWLLMYISDLWLSGVSVQFTYIINKTFKLSYVI